MKATDTTHLEQVANGDRDRLHVLLTASTKGTLAPYVDAFALPHFQAGPNWTLAVAQSIDTGDHFDFAVVVCESEGELQESAPLAQRLVNRRIATAMLIPAHLGLSPVTSAPYLTVVAPTDDLYLGIRMLAHTLLAPVQQQGLVCCDWTDVVTVIEDGTRARLVAIEAPSAAAAVERLADRLLAFQPASAYGAIASVGMKPSDGIRHWRALHSAANSIVRQDARLVVGAPVCADGTHFATAVVLVAPSRRYFKHARGE